MKSIFLIMTLSCFIHNTEPTNDLTEITRVVEDFVSGSDHRDTKQLDAVLHEKFRAIVNQAFGKKEIQWLDKATYLDLIRTEKIGGDSRSVTILSMHVEDKNALVKAKFTGKELVFTSFIQLIQDIDGNWRIISDMPVIEKL